MFPAPDSTHRPGCTPPRGVHGSALDQARPFRPPHQAVGPSTAGAVPPGRRSIRWSSTTSRRSWHRPPRRTPRGAACPHESSATSGPICAVASWRRAHRPSSSLSRTGWYHGSLAHRPRRELSKKCFIRIDNIIIIVDHRNHPPFIKCCAGMGDATGKHVPNSQIHAIGKRHIRMLIVRGRLHEPGA